LLIGATLAAHVAIAPTGVPTKRMSFHNRLLLNRAAVGGLRTIEVMLAVRDGRVAAVTAHVARLGGRVGYSDTAVGYLRVALPIENLVKLVDDSGVDAYQISSLSKASWYRDGRTSLDAEAYRDLETATIREATSPSAESRLPHLSVEQSRAPGFTAEEDVGLDEWIARHPTYDGRGVTIAIVEVGQPDFAHPIFGDAKALDGSAVPKLAGILNTIGLDAPDDTRVELDVEVTAVGTWTQIGERTYIMPRRGTYRFGLFVLPAGGNLVHRFAVLRDAATNQIWLDTDGDADFQDEQPIADVNDRFDVRMLHVTHPRNTQLSVVVGRGTAPHIVHVYVGRSNHNTMTVSVAAGSKTDDGLAYGVAPGARVLLVRNHSVHYRLRDLIEGYLQAISRPEVDLLVDASGIDVVPDTAADFAGLIFSRMIAAHGKPIFHSAGNWHLWLKSVSSLGSVFSVGGSLGPKTFDAFFGGAVIDRLMVHHSGAAGPADDGMLKPDFLAPMHRVAASLKGGNRNAELPKNAPALQLPPGYRVSCCTSASAPYAAGIAALLVSAARQEQVNWSVRSLGRALRVGARFLADWPAHQQGNGVVDVNGAWRELRRSIEIPQIRATAPIAHPLADYAASGRSGAGIIELEGWTAGMTARRAIELERTSGPPGTLDYRVSWTGNDGTFDAPEKIGLPLNTTVSVPIVISVRAPGAHGAIVNLHDPTTDAIVFRTQATVVAHQRVDPHSRSLRVSGAVRLMRSNAHYIDVPAGLAAVAIDLEVIRGSLAIALVPGHGLYPASHGHLYPQFGRIFTKGRYVVALPNPPPGIWALNLANTSARLGVDRALVSADVAEYVATIRHLNATLRSRPTGAGDLEVDVENLESEIRQPVIATSTGTLRSHEGTFLPSGLPSIFDIGVPADAGTLMLSLRSSGSVELYLYDCTTGECFLHNFTLPAAAVHTMLVRNPKPGRWSAAVNPAPFPARAGSFALDVIVAGKRVLGTPSQNVPRSRGARWTETIDVESTSTGLQGSSRVLLVELVDLALERDLDAHPWEKRILSFPFSLDVIRSKTPPPTAARVAEGGGNAGQALLVETQGKPFGRFLGEGVRVVILSPLAAEHQHRRRTEHDEFRR
jgi:Subtilase family